jgi:mannose-6-phosphate isomerase-like protein (cupin superfamily)
MNLKDLALKETATYIKNYATKYPDKWDYFINFVDFCNKADWIQQDEAERKRFIESGRLRKGLLQIWGYFTMFAENPTDVPEIMVNIDSLKDKIESDYQDTLRSSFAILNLSNAENVTNRHNDLTHNFYVQCIGSVIWKIYDSISSVEYKEYTLEPGDAIFVPAGVSHEVVALMPRAAITVAFHGLGEEVPGE